MILKIDETLCAKDGLCVAECPMGIIEFKSEDGFPAPIAGAAELCVKCGHCIAICPKGALEHTAVNSEECRDISKELLPAAIQLEHFFAARRSIRNYREEPIEKELLERAIKMASYAPSGHNSQPVNWLVIETASEKRRLLELVIEWMLFTIKENPAVAKSLHLDYIVAKWRNGEDKILRGAPNVVVVHGSKNLLPAQAACQIALTHFELAAFSLGLGTCWAGYFQAAAAMYPEMAKVLGIPREHRAYGAMMAGYPKFAYGKIPPRNPQVIVWK